jgi:hypothetical protein
MIFRQHVVGKGFGDGGGIEHAGLVGLPEIEEIAALAALVEGTELGAEEFGGGVNGQGGLTGEPARIDGEAGLLDGKQTEMLAGVANGFFTKLDEVEIFGIAGGGLENDFVQSGAATEEQTLPQDRIREDFHQSPGKNKILLHLGRRDPRALLRPFGDEGG